jgi:hypothetical protein
VKNRRILGENEMSASVKETKARNRKMVLIGLAIIFVIVVASSLAYVVFFSSDNDTDQIQLSFTITPPSQIHRGSNTDFIIINVDFNPKDNITLTTTGTGSSWAYFGASSQQYDETSVTITGETDSVPLVLYVPNDAPTGNYTVQIIGTDSAGITSVPLTYSFSVIA